MSGERGNHESCASLDEAQFDSKPIANQVLKTPLHHSWPVRSPPRWV